MGPCGVGKLTRSRAGFPRPRAPTIAGRSQNQFVLFRGEDDGAMTVDLDAHTAAFIPVAIALVMTPGPDFAIIVRNALLGRRQGISTSTGIVTGIMVHAFAAVLGLSALLAASALAFTVIKIVGAVYLLWLGFRILWSTWDFRTESSAAADNESGPSTPTGPRRPAKLSAITAFRQGLVTNVLNPKAPLVFLSILPQFIPRGTPVLSRTLLLSAIIIGAALVWYTFIALLINQVRPVLSLAPVRRALDRITGFVLVGLGVRLFLERRPAI
jgi:threonine/homoserine/homoserine lactone efflux protein